MRYRAIVGFTAAVVALRAEAQPASSDAEIAACNVRALATPGTVFRVNPAEDKVHGDAQLIAGTTQRVDAILAVLRDVFPGQKGFDVQYDRIMSQRTDGTMEAYHVDTRFYAYHCLSTHNVNGQAVLTGAIATPDFTYHGIGTALTVKIGVNSYQGFFTSQKTLTIDGKPRIVHETQRIVGEVSGLRIYGEEKFIFRKLMLIGRAGSSPYVTLTRRQYVEGLIHLADDGWTLAKPNPQGKPPLRREADVRRDKDEMEAYLRDTPAATLDLPARLHVPLGMWHSAGSDLKTPFTDDVIGATEILIQDPGYFRHDVPKYIPQMLVLQWEAGNGDLAYDIAMRFWKSFPAEKLRALLDR